MSHEERLRDAEIQFHTLDRKKKRHTLVTVTVQDNHHQTVALVSNAFGRFGDNTDNGPFNLNVINRVRRNELQGGKMTIRSDPVEGNDDWNFNLTLRLFLDDDDDNDPDHASFIVTGQNVLLDENTFREFDIH